MPRPRDHLGPRSNADLSLDPFNVILNGVRRDEERVGNGSIVEAICGQAGHVNFTLAQLLSFVISATATPDDVGREPRTDPLFVLLRNPP